MDNELKGVGYHLLSYFLSDTKCIISASLRGVTSDWFEDGISANIAHFILNHYKEHNALVNKNIFSSALEFNNASENDKSVYLSIFNKIELLKVKDNNFDYWLNLFCAYHVKREVVKNIQDSIDKLKENDVEGAANLITNTNIPFTAKGILKPSYSIQETADKRWLEYLDRKENPEKYQGLLTSIYEFDVRMNGFRQGDDVAVIVARSGIGKSICLSVIAKNMFINGYDGIFAGAEMTQEANIMRLDSSFSDLSFDYIRDGRLSQQEEEIYHSMLTSQTKSENILLMVPQSMSKTPSMLELEIKNFINKYNRQPQYLIVDYVNIMTLDDVKGKADHQVQREVIEELKRIGEQYNLVIWTASQQTRASVSLKAKNKNYKPGTEAAAMSDFIGNTSTFVLILEETEDDEIDGTLTVSVVKARFGDKKTFKLRKNWKRMSIMDYEEDYTINP